MPRNSSGTYTLPAGNPVVSLTTITSTWANTTLSDLTTAMTDSLSRSGDGSMLASLELFAGVVASPGLTWAAEPTSGLYRNGAGDFRYSISSADVLQIASSGLRAIDGAGGTPSISFISDTDTGFYRPSVNTIGFVGGGLLGLQVDGGHIYIEDGLVGTPGLAFRNDANTGMYRIAGDTIGFTTNGVVRVVLDNTHLDVSGVPQTQFADGVVGTPGISFFGDTNTGIYRPAGDRIAISTGGASRAVIDTLFFETSVPIGTTNGSTGAPSFYFASDPNTGMYRIGADNIGFSVNGTTVLDINPSRISSIVLQTLDGAVGAPAYSFLSDTNSGMYLPVADQPSIAANGTLIVTFFSGGVSLNTGQFRAPDGLVGTPSITFVSDLDTGFYRVGADQLGLTTGGVLRLTTSTTAFTATLPWQGPNGSVSAPAWSFSGDFNTGFYQTTLDQIAISLGGTTAGEIAQGSFTGTLVGCTTSPTVNVFYQRVGKLVHLWVTGAVTGTSNSVAFSMTGLPAALRPTSGVQTLVPAAGFRDNTNGPYIGAVFLTNTDTLIFAMSTVSGSKVTADASGWTGSGTKGLDNSWTCTYSIT